MNHNFIVQTKTIPIHGIITTTRKQNPVVLFIPGISGEALSDRFAPLAMCFAESNFSFVRFQFRGYEEGMTYEDSCLQDELDDLQAIIEYLSKNGYAMHHYGIIGKSFGALKIILSYSPAIACIGLISPATYLTDESNLDKLITTKYKDIAHITDIHTEQSHFSQITCPTIIVHGTKDNVMAMENSQRILQALRSSKKELIPITNGDHSMKDSPLQSQVQDILCRFFEENFPSTA